ncbi:2-C-methyl-D-erythritol 4-phosphate cytidylyltransferase [Skermania sp. ID1734]|uniref:2-C-methyl-D-erythritol 4-phosphate cytidylyltransferase n=1 Tax=Skermania sp. ID1734 TaxID=2597516 RepID=UPI00117CBF7A|nr:2-C-methyl-D-erythritol 4-phosphate cytidylyltransferase [Skermania sp. ID1734]TSD95712.1 2-C-methyl-D-erythritol 4-phosphate cytidylyltransferase [Skermania sp. ID1734]
MQVRGRVVALVPAAGRGTRLGEAQPKAFVEIAGCPMVSIAVEGLLSSGVVDRVVVVVPSELLARAADLVPEQVQVVAGGAERIDSVRAGMDAASDADFVLVHDAARALTPPSLVSRVVSELQAGRSAVVPALPVADTIKTVDDAGDVTGTPDRAQLRAIQTPQGFAADLLRRAYAAAPAGAFATDDAGLVERLGERVHTVPGDPLAFKITTPLDLRLARSLAGG